MKLRLSVLLVVTLTCFGCGDDDSAMGVDTGVDTGGPDTTADTGEDTTTTDTGEADTGEADTGEADTGEADTGGADTPDTGNPDTGTPDTGSPDTGDAGMDASADTGDGLANIGENCRERACRPGLICEGGPTCDDRWVCIASLRPCTDDEVPNCSCGGDTFYGSSTCPEQSIAYSGECRGAEVSCDRRDIRCRALEPTCPDGEIASVVGTCWGPCVRIDECVCETPEECPDSDRYTCHRFRSRCGPYL